MPVAGSRARRTHHMLAVLRVGGLRRLLGVRLAGQFGDGIFQASLAGAVLFNPQRQTSPAAVAAGFAVLLLPYSLLGPFAGVLLDRWSRRQVLLVANLLRALGVVGFAAELVTGVAGVAFYASALVLVSVARFLLAALSASLPHVVRPADLVTANALTTTAGAVVAAVGGGTAVVIRAAVGDANADYALIALLAVAPYLAAAAAAAGFGRPALGPDRHEAVRREHVADVARGLADGARHVLAIPPVRDGLAMIAAHRLCYGVSTVCTLLLYRNYFAPDGFFRAGLGGLGQLVAAVAIGGATASLVTPVAFRRFGAVRWPAALLLLAAAVEAGLGLPYRLPLMLLAAVLLGFVAQAVKISVDTLVQQQVADRFRGRVFSLYDALFNVTLVIAAALTAFVLPSDGHSPASVIVIAAGYAATALVYVRSARRRGDPSPTSPPSTPTSVRTGPRLLRRVPGT